MALAGHVPVRGEIVFAGEQLELEILDADPRRVRRIRLRPHRQATTDSGRRTDTGARLEIPTSAEKDDAPRSS